MKLLFGDINSIYELKQLSYNNNFENIFNNKNISEENKQVFIKGISPEITEEELKEYINKKAPLIKYKNIILLFYINLKNKVFAFIYF